MERKRRGWLERIKRLFVSESKQKPKLEKKVKSKRWIFAGKLKTQQSFALPAPPAAASAVEEEQIRLAEDEQSKHAMAVALATAAAAEAAVAAAHAATEVVRLTGKTASLAPATPPTPYGHEHAALMIQSVYRGYLARRALRALKGLVRLQALIRGQAVRRQTAATLRGLESLMKIQARQRARASSAAAADHPSASPAPDGMDALLRRGRELYYAAAAAVHVRAAAEQGVGQQHTVEGGDERHEPEQGGGRPQARPRAAVCLAPPEREGWDEEAADEQGGDGDAEPAVELAGGVGRIAAAVRQGHPRRAPISKQGRRRRRRRTPAAADGAPLQVQGRQARLRRRRRPRRRRRRRRQAARVLGEAVLHPRREAHAGEGRRRRRGGGGAVPGLHGVDGVRQGQVPVHEHAQGALRRRRGGRLLRAVLPVRRPPPVADPLHVADPVHRQRHRLRKVQPAGGGAAVAAGEGAHDTDEVPVPEVAGTPQLRLRSRAAPAADGAVHPYPVKRNSKHM